MTTLLYVGVVIEMTFVNLMTLHLCAKRKFNSAKILTILTVFSILLIFGAMSIISAMPWYGNGNGAFVLLGVAYLPILLYIYDENTTRIMEIMFSAWIYTMFAFIISVNISKLLPEDYFPIATFAIQTIIYLFTARMFWNFINNRFIFILKNIPKTTFNYLRYGSLLWFLALVVLNISFIQSEGSVFKIIALIFLLVIAAVSYSQIYDVTASKVNEEKMETIVTTDYLTKLPNRYQLYSDLAKLIEVNNQFAIVYLDLNNFKKINDQFGHLVGDEYLKDFTMKTNRVIGDKSKLYRVSGDEFLCCCKLSEVDDVVKDLRGIKFSSKLYGEFMDIGLGVARYPLDGSSVDQLLVFADKIMYEDKEKVKYGG